MPPALLNAYADQIDAVLSEERLRLIDDVRVATGRMERRDAVRHVRDLTKRSDPHAKPKKASKRDLGAMGIGVASG